MLDFERSLSFIFLQGVPGEAFREGILLSLVHRPSASIALRPSVHGVEKLYILAMAFRLLFTLADPGDGSSMHWSSAVYLIYTDGVREVWQLPLIKQHNEIAFGRIYRPKALSDIFKHVITMSPTQKSSGREPNHVTFCPNPSAVLGVKIPTRRLV